MGTTIEIKFAKMKKAFKTRWVKALRSGEFEQGDGYLKQTHNGVPYYCCLGVAKKIFKLRAGRNDNKEYLSIASCKKIGLDLDAQLRLATMNDVPTSFKRIATWIEKHL